MHEITCLSFLSKKKLLFSCKLYLKLFCFIFRIETLLYLFLKQFDNQPFSILQSVTVAPILL